MADAVRGNQELYSLWSNESTPGTTAAPATSCGYVTAASARGRENVAIHNGIGAQQQSRYGAHEAEGEVRFLAQAGQPTLCLRAFRSAGVIPSSSFGFGTTDHGIDLVGAKVDGVNYDFGFDKPIEVSLPLMAWYAVEDTDGGTAVNLSGDIEDFVSCTLTGGLANMQVVEGTISMTNACTRAPGHIGSRTADKARHTVGIKEGGGEVGATLRALLPYDSGVSTDAPTAVAVTLTGSNWTTTLAASKLEGASFEGEAGDGIAMYGYELKDKRSNLSQT